MTKQICEYNKCTGCAVCRDICPKRCISMQVDNLDALHPVIDESLCINCGLCEKSCPNNFHITFRLPRKVIAAWSNNNDIRQTSASGGIAYELYNYWIKKGGVATGVVWNREEGCHFILIEKEGDIPATQNSKYTFSDTAGIYNVVKQKLLEKIPVLFIGVPCQVAGLYSFLKKNYENLTTVDIICHGMPPAAYLQQHIEQIEKNKKEQTSKLSFRDPKYGTCNFTFTLKNKNGKEFYKKKVLSRDNYQLGYHKALIYRESCYSCSYARRERISDITIGDFSGLGRFAPFAYSRRNVSCILQNTNKGADILTEIQSSVSTYERPAEEAFEVEKQLKAPSEKHSERLIFEKAYRKAKNYEYASNLALKKEKRRAVRTAIIERTKVFVYNIFIMLHIKK